MRTYEKPYMLSIEDLMEGIYAASGDAASSGGPECDSIYMNGVWQGQDHSAWNGAERGYKQQFGCLGCPANTDTGCGLRSHYVESGEADSYDVDKGNRKPEWERRGYGPDDKVTDWNM